MGRYRTRCGSSLGFLSLSKRPFNVVVLKAFLEFRGAVAEEFRKGSANRLPLIAEPPRFYQPRQLLSDLFRQIDIYGFHSSPSDIVRQGLRTFHLQILRVMDPPLRTTGS